MVSFPGAVACVPFSDCEPFGDQEAFIDLFYYLINNFVKYFFVEKQYANIRKYNN